MAIKILCLHGQGTNADILEAQTQSMRSLLPSDWEYDFLDGENDCEAAEGIEGVYPGPYFSYYQLPTFKDLRRAHNLLDSVIEEDGPFDGVLGFSQGGALAASYLLHKQISDPLAPAPFRLAIFLDSSLPFSLDEDHGIDLSPLFRNSDGTFTAKTITPTDDVAANLKVGGRSRGNLVRNSSVDSGYESAESLPRVSDRESMVCLASQIRRFHPSVDMERIMIPTAHIYGQNDPYLAQSLRLAQMCRSDCAYTFEHGGHHDLPRAAAPGMAKVILKALARAEFLA